MLSPGENAGLLEVRLEIKCALMPYSHDVHWISELQDGWLSHSDRAETKSRNGAGIGRMTCKWEESEFCGLHSNILVAIKQPNHPWQLLNSFVMDNRR